MRQNNKGKRSDRERLITGVNFNYKIMISVVIFLLCVYLWPICMKWQSNQVRIVLHFSIIIISFTTMYTTSNAVFVETLSSMQ